MSELKPCPFCRGTRIKQYGGGLSQESEITVCSGCFTQVTGHELWNTRPYENKLKADAVREAAQLVMYEYEGEARNRDIAEYLEDYADKLERGE